MAKITGSETKAADIIVLYLQAPQHAAVFCVDEKTAIQALDRLDPVLPLSPGRAERHGFEYDRHPLALCRLQYADGRMDSADGRRRSALERPSSSRPRHRRVEYYVVETASRASRPVGGAFGAPGHRPHHVSDAIM